MGIKWKHFYLVEVWSLCPSSSTQQTQKAELSQGTVGRHLRDAWEQFPAQPIFVKHHVAWPGWALLIESDALGIQPPAQTPLCEKTWNKESSLQMGEAFNWLREPGSGHRKSDTSLLVSSLLIQTARGVPRSCQGEKLSPPQIWTISERQGGKAKSAFLAKMFESAALTHLTPK